MEKDATQKRGRATIKSEKERESEEEKPNSKKEMMLHAAALYVCASTYVAMLTVSITILTQHPTRHAFRPKHTSLFSVLLLPTQNPNKMLLQRSNSGVNNTVHMQSLTHTAPQKHTHVHAPSPFQGHAQINRNFCVCAHARACSPKQDSWSYHTKACESQLSSDGFEMWALPYHLLAHCWE